MKGAIPKSEAMPVSQVGVAGRRGVAAQGVSARSGRGRVTRPAELAGRKAVMLRPGYVLFEDGDVVRVGSSLESGVGNGWKLREVDDVEGEATFERGSVVSHLRVGRPWLPGFAGAGRGPGFSGIVPAGGGPAVVVPDRGHGGAVSMAAEGVTLEAFLSRLAADEGVAVVCEARIDKSLVSVRCVDTPVGDVLAAVARRVNAEVTRIGSLWFIGSLRPQPGRACGSMFAHPIATAEAPSQGLCVGNWSGGGD